MQQAARCDKHNETCGQDCYMHQLVLLYGTLRCPSMINTVIHSTAFSVSSSTSWFSLPSSRIPRTVEEVSVMDPPNISTRRYELSLYRLLITIGIILTLGSEILVLVILFAHVALSCLESSTGLHDWVRKEFNLLHTEHAEIWKHYLGVRDYEHTDRSDNVAPDVVEPPAPSHPSSERSQPIEDMIKASIKSPSSEDELAHGSDALVLPKALKPPSPSPQARSSADEASSSSDTSPNPFSNLDYPPMPPGFRTYSTALRRMWNSGSTFGESTGPCPSPYISDSGPPTPRYPFLASSFSSLKQSSHSSSNSSSPLSSVPPSPSPPTPSPLSSSENSDGKRGIETQHPKVQQPTPFSRPGSYLSWYLKEKARQQRANGSGSSNISEALRRPREVDGPTVSS